MGILRGNTKTEKSHLTAITENLPYQIFDGGCSLNSSTAFVTARAFFFFFFFFFFLKSCKLNSKLSHL